MVDLLLTNLRLDSLVCPFRSIWTSGSNWSDSHLLACPKRTGELIEVPLAEDHDLKLEIQYLSPSGLAYIGIAHSGLAHIPLPEIVDAFAAMTWGKMSGNEVVQQLLKWSCKEATIHDCIVGVAQAWTEWPRYRFPVAQGLEGEALGRVTHELRLLYPNGAPNPIMCEFVSTTGDIWIAFQISRFSAGHHRIAPDALARLRHDVVVF